MKFCVVFVSKSRGENGFRKILRDLRCDRFAMRSVGSRFTSRRFAAGAFARFDILAAFARFGSSGVEICERLKRSAVDFVRAILLPSGARP